MKKSFLCILLSIMMLVPLFVSCSHEADIEEKEAKVYTLYTITEESTTPEAIRQVELALNRTIFYRLGIIVKLEMVTEDKYDELIESKFDEIEKYKEDKKKQDQEKRKHKKDKDKKDDEEEKKDILTGDKIISLLEEGKDIPLSEPRLDIFLVRGYDKYYDLATNKKLAALDEKLNNEAKALRSAIHSTFFTAARVGKNVFGIPINTAIGEYTYLAFDKEYIDKYHIDPKTFKTMEDLQDYLALIKANEPDVIPLEKAMPSAEINFLSNDGFPAIVTPSGYVNKAYEDPALLDYFAMISRYNALGYFSSESKADEKRYAVRFITGNEDSITQLEKDTGREYMTSIYSNPVATNENTIDNIFCVSKYVIANELTDVMELVNALNTDKDLMNILTYGVKGEHYILNDDNQVERLNDNYMMNPQYTGNSFITYTVAGENPDKWKNAIKQNQDSIVSKSLGFTIDYKRFKYKDPENGNKEVEIFEPNYIDIINSVVDKYYPKLMDGTAVEFDYQSVYQSAVDEINTLIHKDLEELYVKRLQAEYAPKIKDDIINKRGDKIYKEVKESYISDLKEYLAGGPLRDKLSDECLEENPDATEEDVEKYIEEHLTDEYINENLYYKYSEEEVNANIQEIFDNTIAEEIATETERFMETSTYKKALKDLLTSEEYTVALDKMLKFDAPSRINKRFDEMIAEYMTPYIETMVKEMSKEIETAVNKFIDDNAERLGLTEEQILVEIGYLKKKAEEDEEEESKPEEKPEEGGNEEEEDDDKFESWFDFVFKIKLRKMYYSIFKDPSKEM